VGGGRGKGWGALDERASGSKSGGKLLKKGGELLKTLSKGVNPELATAILNQGTLKNFQKNLSSKKEGGMFSRSEGFGTKDQNYYSHCSHQRTSRDQKGS